MSAELIALLAGTVLAVGALGFVLYPLFFAVRNTPKAQDDQRKRADDSAILALREIEFDRATGKLSDADYAELRTTYAARALREMRAEARETPETAVDPIEERVRAYRLTHRECPTCGLRPEIDALYCSSCGRFLDRACSECGADVSETSATFCSICGAALAGRQTALA